MVATSRVRKQELFKRILKDILPLRNPGHCKGNNKVILYAVDFLATHGRRPTIDGEGNVWHISGSRYTIAHTDSVMQSDGAEYEPVVYRGGRIHSRNGKRPIGGDDKVGVAISLTIAATCPDISILLFAKEESGCIGSGKWCSRAAKYIGEGNKIELAVQCDRKDCNDLVGEALGVEIASKNAREWANYLLPHRQLVHGGLTDVVTMAQDNITRNAFNMSCGYYLPHSDSEFIVVSHAIQALSDAHVLLRNMPDNLQEADGGKSFRSNWRQDDCEDWHNHWSKYEAKATTPVATNEKVSDEAVKATDYFKNIVGKSVKNRSSNQIYFLRHYGVDKKDEGYAELCLEKGQETMFITTNQDSFERNWIVISDENEATRDDGYVKYWARLFSEVRNAITRKQAGDTKPPYPLIRNTTTHRTYQVQALCAAEKKTDVVVYGELIKGNGNDDPKYLQGTFDKRLFQKHWIFVDPGNIEQPAAAAAKGLVRLSDPDASIKSDQVEKVVTYKGQKYRLQDFMLQGDSAAPFGEEDSDYDYVPHKVEMLSEAYDHAVNMYKVGSYDACLLMLNEVFNTYSDICWGLKSSLTAFLTYEEQARCEKEADEIFGAAMELQNIATTLAECDEDVIDIKERMITN